jgi:hypothetical protein
VLGLLVPIKAFEIFDCFYVTSQKQLLSTVYFSKKPFLGHENYIHYSVSAINGRQTSKNILIFPKIPLDKTDKFV